MTKNPRSRAFVLDQLKVSQSIIVFSIFVRTLVDDGRFGIEVEDQGTGIAPEHLPFIFDRYWRADPARSRSQGRHGLGLAIATRHATLLDAKLEVRSQLGCGSVFGLIWNRAKS